jgi:gluconolactonase
MRHSMALFVLVAAACMTLASSAFAADSSSDIKPLGPIEVVKDGFDFTEGPASDGKGNLYFSNIPKNRVHKLASDGTVSVFWENSNKTNGLMVDRDGRVIGCQMEGQVVAYSPDGKNHEVLAAQYNGKRFNAPNDLVIDKQGGIYFTDPDYAAPQPLPQGIRTIYYLAPGKERVVTRLYEQDLPNPNGIILSPDEKTLYVVPSLDSKMLAFPVLEPGKVGPPRTFCELAQFPRENFRGGDGLAIDVEGNLYITAATGIQIFGADGKPRGFIKTPQKPANCTFAGPDNKTLYITAGNTLYKVQMPIAGHRFAAN